jgi:hypothetical protein
MNLEVWAMNLENRKEALMLPAELRSRLKERSRSFENREVYGGTVKRCDETRMIADNAQ